jgi:hypothetical protein
MSDMAAQDRQLVAEHDDLKVFRLGRPQPQDQQLQNTMKPDVNSGQSTAPPRKP